MKTTILKTIVGTLTVFILIGIAAGIYWVVDYDPFNDDKEYVASWIEYAWWKNDRAKRSAFKDVTFANVSCKKTKKNKYAGDITLKYKDGYYSFAYTAESPGYAKGVELHIDEDRFYKFTLLLCFD